MGSIGEVGRCTEGIDIEAENASADEIAFVQVKSSATQATLDDYVSRFNERRDRYKRMIFVVHSPSGNITPPPISRCRSGMANGSHASS